MLVRLFPHDDGGMFAFVREIVLNSWCFSPVDNAVFKPMIWKITLSQFLDRQGLIRIKFLVIFSVEVDDRSSWS